MRYMSFLLLVILAGCSRDENDSTGLMEAKTEMSKKDKPIAAGQGPRKILMIVGDYTEDYEVMVPYQALTMIGHTVHAVCPGKDASQKIRTCVHDFEGDQRYSEKKGHDFQLNATFDKIKV